MGKAGKFFLACAALLGGSALLANPARAADVSAVSMSKVAAYEESNFAAPTLSNYYFSVSADTPGETTGATLSGAATETLTNSSLGDFYNSPLFPTLTQFDSAFPDAAYSLTIDAVHDGVQTVTLNFSGASYGPVVQITAATVTAGSILVEIDPVTLTSNEVITFAVTPVGSHNLLGGSSGQIGGATSTASIQAIGGANFETAGPLEITAIVQNLVGTDTNSADYPGVQSEAWTETYTEMDLPASAPEPASLALLSLGLFPLLRRPKRITR